MTIMNPKSAIPKDARIFVAGHRGLMGQALVRVLQEQGYSQLILRTREECDLTDKQQVDALFEATQPEYVFVAAAKVGGIWANSHLPAEFIYQNLQIQNNVIDAAYRHATKRLLFLGSSCIYPRDCPQPIKESYLLSGHLEWTNRPYAVAKIAGIEMCWAYNRQYGTQFLSAMPTNLYGPGDNYDLKTSHVIPALLRKVHEAKQKGDPTVTVWGTGAPRREFLYSDDCARACVHLLGLPDAIYTPLTQDQKLPPLINVGCGSDVTIRSLVETIQNVVGYQGELVFDTSKPDGTPRKVLDITTLSTLGWKPQNTLEEGLVKAYADFCEKVTTLDKALA